MKGSSRDGQAFQQAVQSVERSDSSFDAYFQAMRARKEPQQATVATGHKLVRTVYSMLLCGEPFHTESTTADEGRKERERKQLTRHAQKLGYQITPAPSKAAPAPVETP